MLKRKRGDIMENLIIGVLTLFLLGIYFVLVYNGIITLANKVNEAFSTIEVYLKKRYDLIPKLVDAVDAYILHEKQTLNLITETRNASIIANKQSSIIELNNKLSKNIEELMILVESYPSLKANQNFIDLQAQLVEIEENIADARKYYNGSVRMYNNYICIFPNVIIANILGKKQKNFFEINNEEKQNIIIK
ncbi:MAG: hypothetical protein A2Y22_07290 [Clostridiales bacterium GWD2_32_59]|nr:MAG: hypothetical protein A2Y22_07290 [Clostridiales bacterium GWD2_32_59]